MPFNEKILAGFAFTLVFILSALIYRPKNQSEFCGAGLATIFALGCLLVVEENTNQAIYFCMCLLWIPLTVEDAINQHVSAKLLYFSTFMTVMLSMVLGYSSVVYIALLGMIIIGVVFLVRYFEYRSNRVLVGAADYFACLAFISVLPASTIGLWFIVFPLLGIIGYLTNARSSQKIPMLPYMLAGWCLVFTRMS
jgi:hypothetical protein